MSIGGKIKSFVTGEKAEEKEEKEKEEEKRISESKYPNEPCALCSGKGCDKKWAGQYWHKKCMRTMRKKAKGMV